MSTVFATARVRVPQEIAHEAPLTREEVDPAAWIWQLPFVVHDRALRERQGHYLIRIWMCMRWLLVMREADRAGTGLGIGTRELSRVSGICRETTTQCVDRLIELDLVQVIGYESGDQVLDYGTTFPSDALPDDLFYHSTNRIIYRYHRDGTWHPTRLPHPRRCYTINIRHLEEESFPLFLSVVRRMGQAPPQRRPLHQNQPPLDLWGEASSDQGGGRNPGQGWPESRPGVAGIQARGGRGGMHSDQDNKLHPHAEKSNQNHGDVPDLAGQGGRTIDQPGLGSSQGWTEVRPSGEERRGKEKGWDRNALAHELCTILSAPAQKTEEPDGAAAPIHADDAQHIARAVAELFFPGGNIQHHAEAPIRDMLQRAGIDTPPVAPEGEMELCGSLASLWETLGMNWNRGGNKAQDMTRLHTLSRRIDKETGGYGEYWVCRAILDADEVAMRTPDQAPRHGLAYVDAIIQRWRRDGSWGEPYQRSEAGSGEREQPAQAQIQEAGGEALPDHAAIAIYREVTAVIPPPEHVDLIIQQFADGTEHDLDIWRDCATEWKQGVTTNGFPYNVRNVAGLLNFYRKKRQDLVAERARALNKSMFHDAYARGEIDLDDLHQWYTMRWVRAETDERKLAIATEFETFLASCRAERESFVPEQATAPAGSDGEAPPAELEHAAAGSNGEAPPAALEHAVEAEELDEELARDEERDPSRPRDEFDAMSRDEVIELARVVVSQPIRMPLSPAHLEALQRAEEERQFEAMVARDLRVAEREAEQEQIAWAEQDDAYWRSVIATIYEKLSPEQLAIYLEKCREDQQVWEEEYRKAIWQGHVYRPFRQMQDRQAGEGDYGFTSAELMELAKREPWHPEPEEGWASPDDRWELYRLREHGIWHGFTQEELQAWAAEHPQHPEHPEDRLRELGFDPDIPLIDQGFDFDNDPDPPIVSRDYLESLGLDLIDPGFDAFLESHERTLAQEQERLTVEA